MSNKNNKQEIINKTDIDWIKKELRSIKDNHLPSLDKKIDAQTKWLIATLSAVILTLINTFFR